MSRTVTDPRNNCFLTEIFHKNYPSSQEFGHRDAPHPLRPLTHLSVCAPLTLCTNIILTSVVRCRRDTRSKSLFSSPQLPSYPVGRGASSRPKPPGSALKSDARARADGWARRVVQLPVLQGVSVMGGLPEPAQEPIHLLGQRIVVYELLHQESQPVVLRTEHPRLAQHLEPAVYGGVLV